MFKKTTNYLKKTAKSVLFRTLEDIGIDAPCGRWHCHGAELGR